MECDAQLQLVRKLGGKNVLGELSAGGMSGEEIYGIGENLWRIVKRECLQEGMSDCRIISLCVSKWVIK